MFLTSCGNILPPSSYKLQVASTPTIIGDVVQEIGCDLIDLTVLLQPGTDPHK